MLRLILSCLGILLSMLTVAQQYGHRQYDRIQRAYVNGVEFTELKLFTAKGIETNPKLNKYVTLAPVRQNISGLYMRRENAVSLTVQAATGKTYTLEMLQSHPVSDNADVGYIDHEGRQRMNYEQALHYQGAIRGEEMSLATMSVFANGDVMILFSDKDGNFVIGKMENDADKYVMYNTKERTEAMPFNCLVKDEQKSIVRQKSRNKTTGAIECKKVRIYWEADSFLLWRNGGSVTATQNYLTGLFNVMQGIYYNDGVVVELTGLYVWTVADRYNKQYSFTRVYHFYGYWDSQQQGFPGDLAMLLGLSPSGGLGYLEGVCGPRPYSISAIYSGYNNFPAYDWDVYVTAHETGHNFYTLHTHACDWNTGLNGTCGSIDNCTTQEAGVGCSTCPTLFDRNNSGWFGTVMSYCGININFSAGFGPIIAAHLRNVVDTASCLTNVIQAELLAKDICNGDGEVMLNFKQNNYGVAPYSYLWSNSATTKDISNLVSPGTYSVSITDSNNCMFTDSVIVKDYGKPGDGQALTYTMPMCCIDTSYTVTINAALPVALSSCQTVGWLRTTAPITSYSAAEVAYSSATTVDILKSDNDTSISNTQAARLTVKSPDSCKAVQTYYYTPFVTQKPRAASVYTAAGGNAAQVRMIYEQIGDMLIIPDQSTSLTSCDKNNKNITDTITVNVSNYTGRVNYLTIRVTGEDDEQELYLQDNLAGNGTYTIPITGIENHMQKMTVRAYDHNCTGGDICVVTSMTLQANRKVTYSAIPALTFDSSCVVGTSVMLSFGPDSCNVAVTDIGYSISNISLIPNPAHETVSLEYYAQLPGAGNVRIVDISGRVMHKRPVIYRYGTNKELFSVAGWAKGMYFVLIDTEGYTQKLKLLVQ